MVKMASLVCDTISMHIMSIGVVVSEVEAGRAILGNAIFRDLFQAMVMTDVDHLCLALPNVYKYRSRGRILSVPYYPKAVSVADALYGHTRVTMPYGLTVL